MDTHRVAGQTSQNSELDMFCVFIHVGFVMKTRPLAFTPLSKTGYCFSKDEVQTLEHIVMLPEELRVKSITLF